MADGRIKDLNREISDFSNGDFIAVDGNIGSSKMAKDSLLKVTAKNALAGNVAPAFDPTRDEDHKYLAGERVTYTDGKVYTFKVDHYGAWDAADVEHKPISDDVESLCRITTTDLDMNDAALWKNGSINSSTGEVTLSGSGVVTPEMIAAIDESFVQYSKAAGVSTLNVNFAAYDSSKTFMTYAPVSTYETWVASHPTAKFFRFSVSARDSSSVVIDIDPANLSDVVVFGENLTINNVATIGYVKGLIHDVSEDISKLNKVIATDLNLNSPDIWHNGAISSSNGRVTLSNVGTGGLVTPKLIVVLATEFVSYTKASGVSTLNVNFAAYDKDENFLTYAAVSTFATWIASHPEATLFRYTLSARDSSSVVIDMTPANLSDVVTFSGSLKVGDIASPSYVDSEVGTVAGRVSYLENLANTVIRAELDLNDTTIWHNGAISSSNGKITLYNVGVGGLVTPLMREVIDKNFVPYTKASGVSTLNVNFAAYDKDENFLTYAAVSTFATWIASHPEATLFRYTLSARDSSSVVIDMTPADLSDVVSFGAKLHINKTASKDYVNKVMGNVLDGKTWYACGSSSTSGAGTQFDSGKYKGQYKAYPQFVGLRNDGLTVVNYAKSGSTLSYIEGFSTEENCFVYPLTGKLYTIPPTADIITLKLGVNDCDRQVPLGTIDSEDISTYYGAWNVALRYLITNFPFAKIGVIVLNGCSNTAYPQAVKDCAEKWGVAYLDENFDYKVPLLIHVTGKPNVSAEALALRHSQFEVAPGNHHPNDAAQEFESTIFENFLRSL